jgi:hypothetical protein
MNRLQQLLTIAEMQGRDLLRRRGALLMLAAMPLAFYFALLGKGGYAITTGGVGMAFSVSGAALFSMLAAKRIEPRLVLAGYRPLDLLLGRLLLLETLGLVIVLLTTALMTLVSQPPHPEFVLAGIALTVWVAVPLGLAIATLIARELEGVLAAIAVVGVQLSLPIDSPAAPFLPLYGPLQILAHGGGIHASLLAGAGSGLGYGVALLGVATLAWRFRLRIRPVAR